MAATARHASLALGLHFVSEYIDLETLRDGGFGSYWCCLVD